MLPKNTASHDFFTGPVSQILLCGSPIMVFAATVIYTTECGRLFPGWRKFLRGSSKHCGQPPMAFINSCRKRNFICWNF
jgi:hypothetical protein